MKWQITKQFHFYRYCPKTYRETYIKKYIITAISSYNPNSCFVNMDLFKPEIVLHSWLGFTRKFWRLWIKGREVDTIYLDRSKAFHRIQHRVLLDKLKRHGLEGHFMIGLRITSVEDLNRLTVTDSLGSALLNVTSS